MMPLFRERSGGEIEGRAHLAEPGLKLNQLLLTGIEIGEIGDHPGGERRKTGDGDRIFAGGGAQREEALFRALQFLGVVFRLAQRRLDGHLRVGKLVQRLVEQFDGLFQQARRLVALALQPAHQRGDQRHGRGIAVQEIARLADVAGDALGLHHAGADFRQRLLLAVLRREHFQFLDGGAQVIGLAGGGLHLLAVAAQRAFGFFPLVIERSDIGGRLAETAEGIEQQAVRIRVDQRAVVVLAVDFHEKLAGLPHELHGNRLVVDIGLGAPVGGLLAAEDEVAVVVYAVVAEQRPDRMIARHVEHGRHLPALDAVAHQRTVAAPAERQRKTVEEDGLTGARLARQHGKTRLEREVEPFDQDDIADR
jgi:hypothetical protein